MENAAEEAGEASRRFREELSVSFTLISQLTIGKESPIDVLIHRFGEALKKLWEAFHSPDEQLLLDAMNGLFSAVLSCEATLNGSEFTHHVALLHLAKTSCVLLVTARLFAESTEIVVTDAKEAQTEESPTIMEQDTETENTDDSEQNSERHGTIDSEVQNGSLWLPEEGTDECSTGFTDTIVPSDSTDSRESESSATGDGCPSTSDGEGVQRNVATDESCEAHQDAQDNEDMAESRESSGEMEVDVVNIPPIEPSDVVTATSDPQVIVDIGGHASPSAINEVHRNTAGDESSQFYPETFQENEDIAEPQQTSGEEMVDVVNTSPVVSSDVATTTFVPDPGPQNQQFAGYDEYLDDFEEMMDSGLRIVEEEENGDNYCEEPMDIVTTDNEDDGGQSISVDGTDDTMKKGTNVEKMSDWQRVSEVHSSFSFTRPVQSAEMICIIQIVPKKSSRASNTARITQAVRSDVSQGAQSGQAPQSSQTTPPEPVTPPVLSEPSSRESSSFQSQITETDGQIDRKPLINVPPSSLPNNQTINSASESSADAQQAPPRPSSTRSGPLKKHKISFSVKLEPAVELQPTESPTSSEEATASTRSQDNEPTTEPSTSAQHNGIVDDSQIPSSSSVEQPQLAQTNSATAMQSILKRLHEEMHGQQPPPLMVPPLLTEPQPSSRISIISFRNGIRFFDCLLCPGWSSQYHTDIRDHILNTHREHYKSFYCFPCHFSDCDFRAVYESGLQSHLQQEHPMNQMNQSGFTRATRYGSHCPTCGIPLHTLTQVVCHFEGPCRLQDGLLMCFCGMPFRMVHTFNAHRNETGCYAPPFIGRYLV